MSAMTTSKAWKRAMAMLFVFAAAGLSALGGSPNQKPGAEQQQSDDDEERAYQRAVAGRLVRENCLMCHSDELIATQRLTAKQWKAEVEKMVGWGASLSGEQQGQVIDYLSAEYPDTAPAARLTRTALNAALRADKPDATPTGSPKGDPQKGAVLYAQNCQNCHGELGQGSDIGTNLVQKPVLFRSADFAEVVRQGRGRMPGFAAVVNRAGEADINAWLRAKQYQPPIPAAK
jgi:mono/diheme cytochrome c family protein